MKYLCVTLLLTCAAAVAQNPLTGSWEVPGYLGLETTSEYVLYKSSTGPSVLDIADGGQFKNFLAYGCGMNCFKHNTGTVEMADSTHVRFTLTGQEQDGICHDVQAVPTDLGLYAIVKENDTIIRLIKSDGTAQNDALMKRYSAIANSAEMDFLENYETKTYEWREIPKTTSPQAVVDYFVKATPGFSGQAEMVFVTSYFFAEPLILFEQEGTLYALIHNTVADKVALYGAIK